MVAQNEKFMGQWLLEMLDLASKNRVISHSYLSLPKAFNKVGVSIVMGVPPSCHFRLGFPLIKHLFWGDPHDYGTPHMFFFLGEVMAGKFMFLGFFLGESGGTRCSKYVDWFFQPGGWDDWLR